MSQLILPIDHDEIFNAVGRDFDHFSNRSFTVFGGTGFVGKWLVSTLALYNRSANANIKINVVSRDPKRASGLFDEFSQANLKFLDSLYMKDNTIPPSDFYIHGATPTVNSGVRLGGADKFHLEVAEYICEAAVLHENSPIVLHLSSGAVYGPQSLDQICIPESAPLTTNPQNPYTKAKFEIEEVFQGAVNLNTIRLLSPRLFAFAGPHLPLDAHFAIGNFIHDAINLRPITLTGNSETIRSYMYAGDLIICLLKILRTVPTEPINIGSDEPISMRHLAELISNATHNLPIRLSGEDKPASTYVPSIENLRANLPDINFLPIDEILDRWLRWIAAS